jgi:HD-GYP domain-containing protein (c-di-GMP phosphodiesterase class II)
MSQAEATTLRQAGLIHDLGRVGVQSAIWDKEGPLLDSEWERVRLHPYYTERIVARPKALAQLGALAALHHERLDGSGYFRALPASGLSPAARLLAAADVYHAMTEPRPHRVPLEPEAAASALKQEVRNGRIDSDAANAVLAAAGHRVQPVRHERVAGLTEREIEVLRLVARGHSNRVIAGVLGLTPKTVGNHIQNIYSKIDVSTRAGATVFAMQHGIV